MANLDAYKQVAETTVNFKFNSDKLDADSKMALDQMVANQSQYKRFFIAVEGFTDRVGNADYNARSSRRRADAVMEYLVAEHNVPVYRVHMIGSGEQKPVDDGRGRAANAKNRRVEVTLFSADQSLALNNSLQRRRFGSTLTRSGHARRIPGHAVSIRRALCIGSYLGAMVQYTKSRPRPGSKGSKIYRPIVNRDVSFPYPPAFLVASTFDRILARIFDDTFAGIHQLSWFDWALLIPYFGILGVLSIYGMHRFETIRTYFKYRKKATREPAAAFRATAPSDHPAASL